MQCRVCGSESVIFESVKEVLVCEGLELKHTPFENKKSGMVLYRCPCCTHVQTENTLPDHYYRDYNELSGAAQYIGPLDFTRKKLEKLRAYAHTNTTFLDIGCGTGKALGDAGDLFERCIGVEPAHNTYQIAKDRGFHVINAYFSKDLKLKEQISAFSAFQVFEHLSDIGPVLDYAFEILEPGGVGLINVPNGQTIIGQALYHQLVFEHVNYFSPYSASVMAHRAGFDVIEVENVPRTIELDLYVKKPARGIGFDESLRTQRERLGQLLKAYPSVVVWGAGAKSAKYAQLLGTLDKVEHLVDADTGKAGMYVGGIDCPVKTASAELVERSPAVVIFASSYHNEIIHRLRDDFGYKGDIIYFEGSDLRLLKYASE